jgi:hypothetical protein
VGVEFGLDVGALGPLPEFGFFFFVGFFLEECQAFAFEVEASGADVTATKRT